MIKIYHVARREFIATVLTKAFLLGLLVGPAIMIISILVTALLTTDAPPNVKGSVLVIAPEDPVLRDRLRERFAPEGIRAAVQQEVEQVGKVVEQAAGAMGNQAPTAIAAAQQIAQAAPIPELTLDLLEAGTAPDQVSPRLLQGDAFDGSALALVVIPPEAVRAAAGQGFSSFDLLVKDRLDARAQNLIRDQARDAVLDARIQAAGQSPQDLRALMRIDPPAPRAVTAEGVKPTGGFQQFILPFAFMMLLWMSAFTGGQYLLTSTIEEKSNRVMEVLLSAVSPVQLMAGKIIGQMAAGLVVLLLYSGMGLLALIYFNRPDLIQWSSLGFLVIFFFIAFFLIGALFAAVGSAVTDVHEAQTLLGPIMLVIFVPLLLMFPIIQNPSGPLATILSFIPPINPFVMILRLASTEPPPLWQTWLSVGVGVAAVLLAVNLAAKIFRVGVLMYGKPPDFRTLIKWIRMA